ncbi:hypothetical protein EVAR_88634_1 [Eumeta japonica]|uniref:Uncharacterized protein n=1 Tax=Eumeta variegata TaxID=151549 RepID=A0A4C1X433_EUMVA|nr:hypothetical protein EVAR_88634_1 [Eumeta japonica]
MQATSKDRMTVGYLMQSMEQCKIDHADNSLKDFFDNIPISQTVEGQMIHTQVLNFDELAGGEHLKDVTDCQPDYMAQSLCKSLIYMYRRRIAGPIKIELSKGNLSEEP